MQTFIANHLYKRSFISYLLLPLAMINFIIQKIRRQLPRKQFVSKAKIISIGNITSGGSGKTPTTIYLAKLLHANGKKIAVSHRGYKGKFEQNPTLISDENGIFDFAYEAGDEAYLLATKLTGIPVVAGRKRKDAILLLEQKYPEIEYIILDDSFQHLQVRHDYDFIVFNALGKIGNGFLLPAGILREPLSALKYANQIIYNGLGNIPDSLKKYNLPIARAKYKITSFQSATGEIIGIDKLQKSRCALISAIGIPESFEKTILENKIFFLKHFAFNDHYDFSNSKQLEKIAKENYEYLIITEKDWAKLQFIEHNLPLVIAHSEFEIENLKLDFV